MERGAGRYERPRRVVGHDLHYSRWRTSGSSVVPFSILRSTPLRRHEQLQLVSNKLMETWARGGWFHMRQARRDQIYLTIS